MTGIALPPGDRALHEPRLSSARSLLGEREWEEALAKGREMSLEEAAGYVFVQGSGRSTHDYCSPGAIGRRTRSPSLQTRAGGGCPRRAGSHQPPDLCRARDLRAHGEQPCRQNPRQAETPFTGPDRQLGNRTRPAHVRPAIELPALSAPRKADRRPWEPILACTRAKASCNDSRLPALSPCGCRVVLPSYRASRPR